MCLMLAGSLSLYATDLNISGAGPSTVVVQLLADSYMAANPDYSITVPPKSIKHLGGMKWATAGNAFGRTGRPLSTEDKKAFPMLEELIIAEVPLGFAVDKSLGIKSLTMDQWEGIFRNEITNWKELGGADLPINLLGREKKESVYSALAMHYPFLADVRFLKIYNTEDQILRGISSIRGSIGFSSISVMEDNPKLQILSIPGFSASLSFGLVYDKANRETSTVQDILSYVNSPSWGETLKVNGMTLAE